MDSKVELIAVGISETDNDFHIVPFAIDTDACCWESRRLITFEAIRPSDAIIEWLTPIRD